MAYIWPIYGLYMAYTRPIYGPYMAYIERRRQYGTSTAIVRYYDNADITLVPLYYHAKTRLVPC